MKGLGSGLTLFGRVEGNNVVFCIDRSGSINKYWDVVCTHLMEHIRLLEARRKQMRFNVIVFDDHVECFRSRLIRFSPHIIFELRKWLQNMVHASTSYLLPAIMAAFTQPFVEAVYMVTAGTSALEGPELFHHLPVLCNSRPLHSKLLVENNNLHMKVLRLMAKLTAYSCCANSSLCLVNVQFRGVFVSVNPSKWSPVIPSHLFGKPNDCLQHIVRSWISWNTRIPEASGISEEEQGKKAVFSEFSSTTETKCEHVEHQPSNKEKPPVCHQSVQSSVTNETDIVKKDITKDADNSFGTMIKPDLSPSGQIYNTNTPQIRQWYERDTYSAPEYLQGGSENRVMEVSRYRAARSFMSGHTGLDQLSDNPEWAPSAGLLLLGRCVLAPNQNDCGKLYLGTVISEVNESTFLVNFGHPNEKSFYSEYIQEIHVMDILSYLDLHRHELRKGDSVLVPQSALEQYDKIAYEPGSSPYYLEPFYMAIVEDGYERRCAKKDLLKSEMCLSVRIMPDVNTFGDCEKFSTEQLYKVRPNAAVWIPSWLITKVSQKRQSSVPAKNLPDDLKRDAMEFTPTNALRCDALPIKPFYSLLPHAHGDTTLNPMKAAYTTEQIEEMAKNIQSTGNKTFNESIPLSLSSGDDGEQDQPPGVVEGSLSNYEDTEGRRIHREFCNAFKSVDGTSEVKMKSIDWLGSKRRQSQKPERPHWKYWGHKPIPDLLDPPSHEPYRDNPDRRYATIATNIASGPDVHSSSVSLRPTQPLNYRDSTRIHLALRESSTCPADSRSERQRSTPSVRYITEPRPLRTVSAAVPGHANNKIVWPKLDSVGLAMHDYHRERILLQLKNQQKHG
ncbi:hypothetical protein CRM22_004507 [Opisthorchis felineus]|uniref:Uncharacterized protein n=1 Tax=Opisthorchis felineus TaxID=147828 RepID=A0A4S2M250_OPIFE|nr:hypothetical protein CRM22_004507 [Opisthorchis felineus]TGZ67948.1 hypothetical protein CRM22_004507 [Opisthorchis felineus]